MGATLRRIPSNTAVGYWLWGRVTGEVMRGFVIPRGISVFAGGTAAVAATASTLKAAHSGPHLLAFSVPQFAHRRRLSARDGALPQLTQALRQHGSDVEGLFRNQPA